MEPEKEPSWSARISKVLPHLRRIRSSVSAFFASAWSNLASIWSKLHTSIQKAIDSIRPQDNTKDERADSQDKRPHPVPPKSDSPSAPTNKKKAYKRCGKGFQIATFVVEVLGLCGLTVYACITYGQLQAMLDSNKINRDSLQTVQRAFVFVRVIEAVRIGDTANFIVTWENSGTTPTRDLNFHASFMPSPTPLPDDFPFPDLWTPGTPQVTVNALIGPKATTIISVGPINISIINQIFEHHQHLYLWGWAKYHDVFERTPMHTTRFCVELIVVNRTPIPGEKNQFQFLIRPDTWRKNNCYDEECEK